MNNKSLVVSLIILGLFCTALISHNGDIAWMMLIFLVYLGMGILHSPVLDWVRLKATRSLEPIRSNGIVSVNATLTVQNTELETVHLFISETVQAEMKISDGTLSRWATIKRGESTGLTYTFSAARGDFSWKTVKTVLTDPLGLIETGIILSAPAMIQIRPQIKKFKAIPMRPHSTLHSPGSIPARLGGSGTDFFGVREYHPGDSLRSLDWRLTARHPRKFFTKEFEQEEIADIGFLLDARHSTDLHIGEESLFEQCLGATASLAEMFLHQGHRVSLLVFGKTMSNVFPGYGKTQLHRVMSCLSRAKVEQDDRGSAHLDFLPIRMFPTHSLIIVLSPLTSADRSLFQRLRAFGYQVMLISPDPIDFAYPTLERDINSRFAIRVTRIERQIQLNSISQLQIPVIDWNVRQPLFPLVRNALTRTHNQLEL
jgi:uncharacterized protein (DUF58 family)